MSFNRKFILKSGSFSTLEVLSNQLLGLAGFFILVRLMTKQDFGIWVLYMSTTTLLEQARIGFIKNGFVKYLTDADKDTKGEVLFTSFVLNILVFVVTALICVFLGLYVGTEIWHTEVLKEMFLWYIPYAFLLTFYLQFKMIEQAHFDFKGSFLTAFSRRIFFISAIIFLAAVGRSIDLILLVYLNLASIVIGVIGAYFLARKKLTGTMMYKKAWLAKLSSFGIYTFGTNLGAMFLRNIDQFMLGTFSNKVFLAFYNTAIRITNLVEIPTNAMSSIVYPKGVSLAKHGKREDLKDMYERSVAIILMFVLPIVFIVLLFPKIFILIVAGEAYLDAVPYLRVTILFALFVPFMRQAGTVLDSMGKPKINFYLTLSAAVVNVVSNIVFIHFYGPIGAAYGTLVSYLIIIIVNQIFLRKFLNVSFMNILYSLFSYYKTGVMFSWRIITR